MPRGHLLNDWASHYWGDDPGLDRLLTKDRLIVRCEYCMERSREIVLKLEFIEGSFKIAYYNGRWTYTSKILADTETSDFKEAEEFFKKWLRF